MVNKFEYELKMSLILNRSIEDNRNIIKNLKDEVQRIAVSVLLSQSNSEINELENELNLYQ